jgi:hypothetical protein
MRGGTSGRKIHFYKTALGGVRAVLQPVTFLRGTYGPQDVSRLRSPGFFDRLHKLDETDGSKYAQNNDNHDQFQQRKAVVLIRDKEHLVVFHIDEKGFAEKTCKCRNILLYLTKKTAPLS